MAFRRYNTDVPQPPLEDDRRISRLVTNLMAKYI